MSDLTEATERLAKRLADLEPDDQWPTNEALGGHPLLGVRDDEYKHAMRDEANEYVRPIEAAVREQIRARILTDVHSEGNGVPFDSHYDVAIVAAWIDEWFDR